MSFVDPYIVAIRAIKDYDIDAVVDLLVKKVLQRKLIVVCGNGGSASIAEHFVCDLQKGAGKLIVRKQNIICLNSNVSVMTAIANDSDYSNVFLLPAIWAGLTHDSVVVTFSVSGTSPNIKKIVGYADLIGASIISFRGIESAPPISEREMLIRVGCAGDYYYGTCESAFSVLTHIIATQTRKKLKERKGDNNEYHTNYCIKK